MGTRVFEFKDFSGGEYGRLQAWRAPKNMWTGTNMLVYETGELGVRPGLKALSLTGGANGAVSQLYTAFGGTTRLLYAQGTALRSLDPEAGGAITTAATALGSTPNNAAAWARYGSSMVYVSVDSVTTYSVNTSGATPVVTALAGAPQSAAISAYGDRLVLGKTGTPGNTLRYSDAVNYASWPAANTITVGTSDEQVTGLWAQRTHLVVHNSTTGFYILTGVPGFNDVLRHVSSMRGPIAQTAGALDAMGLLHFISQDNPCPHVFDGSTAKAIAPHLFVDNSTATLPAVTVRCVAPVQFPGSVFYTDYNGTNNGALLRHNGVWTTHTFGAIDATRRYLAMDVPGSLLNDTRALMIIADVGTAGSQPTFYQWILNQNSPGIEGGTYQRAGDNSASQVSGSVTFPEQHTDDGSDIQVRGVLVDFRKWNTGGSNTNHFDLTVNALRSYETAGPVASTTVSWDEAGSSSSASGTLDRAYFSLGDQGRGGGFQLAFTNIRGIAIQRIQVITETYPPRF